MNRFTLATLLLFASALASPGTVGAGCADVDQDSVCDDIDTCVGRFNPEQISGHVLLSGSPSDGVEVVNYQVSDPDGDPAVIFQAGGDLYGTPLVGSGIHQLNHPSHSNVVESQLTLDGTYLTYGEWGYFHSVARLGGSVYSSPSGGLGIWQGAMLARSVLFFVFPDLVGYSASNGEILTYESGSPFTNMMRPVAGPDGHLFYTHHYNQGPPVLNPIGYTAQAFWFVAVGPGGVVFFAAEDFATEGGSWRVFGKAPDGVLQELMPPSGIPPDGISHQFSPDGSSAALAGDFGVVSVAFDSGPPTSIHPESVPFRISNTHVAYLASAADLLLIPIEGGTPVQVNPTVQFPTAFVADFDFTPDGSRLLLSGEFESPGRRDLYTVPIEGGAAERIVAPVPWPSVSTIFVDDDNVVLFTLHDGSLYSAPTGGGVPTQINVPGETSIVDVTVVDSGAIVLYRALIDSSEVEVVAHRLSGGDVDGDGLDLCDNCPTVANPDQMNGDPDNLGDACDNCPTDFNPSTRCIFRETREFSPFEQCDADGDGEGDLCDFCPDDPLPDTDGDAICTAVDNCPDVVNPTQNDSDGDGDGDACDTCPDDPGDDADHDSICGDVDNCPNISNVDQVDWDGDFEGDLCDEDDGRIVMYLEDSSSLSWQGDSFERWSIYRGDLGALRAGGDYIQAAGTHPAAETSCGLSTPSHFDSWFPEPHAAAFYLVTGTSGGVESDLGTDSSGALRPNTNPCP